ncbi:MAG TPA: TRAP transporter small permease subunit [Desulfosarcina sp.]|nr:TRAP transporter small permease subunit [Desulfosarcina sp.]
MNILRRVDDALARIESGIVLLSFISLVVLILMDVLSRLFFHFASHALFEAGPQLVLWLALMGASLGLKQQRHIRIELVLRHCGIALRRAAAVAVNLFGAAVMGVLLAASLDFVGNEVAMFGARGRWSLIFPLFFGLAAFRFLTQVAIAACGHQVRTPKAQGSRPR